MKQITLTLISTPKEKYVDACKIAKISNLQIAFLHSVCVEPKFTNLEEYFNTPREYTVTIGIKE